MALTLRLLLCVSVALDMLSSGEESLSSVQCNWYWFVIETEAAFAADLDDLRNEETFASSLQKGPRVGVL